MLCSTWVSSVTVILVFRSMYIYINIKLFFVFLAGRPPAAASWQLHSCDHPELVTTWCVCVWLCWFERLILLLQNIRAWPQQHIEIGRDSDNDSNEESGDRECQNGNSLISTATATILLLIIIRITIHVNSSYSQDNVMREKIIMKVHPQGTVRASCWESIIQIGLLIEEIFPIIIKILYSNDEYHWNRRSRSWVTLLVLEPTRRVSSVCARSCFVF